MARTEGKSGATSNPFGSIALLLILALFIYGAYREYYHFSPGAQAHLTKNVLLTVDDDSATALRDALAINDSYGVQELVTSGKAMFVDGNTNLLVLEVRTRFFDWTHWRRALEKPDDPLFIRRVRILNGQSRGKTVWVTDAVIAPKFIEAASR